MGLVKDNNCVGCPQGCIHCGRGDFQYYECDQCGDTSFDTKIYTHNGGYFCWKCLLKNDEVLEDFINDYGEEWVAENFMEVDDDE